MNNKIERGPSLAILKSAGIIIIIAAMYFARSIIMPVLLALFITIICAQPILWLEKKKVPQGLAVIIVLIGILSIFFGLGYLIGNGISTFTADTSSYETKLKSIVDSFVKFLNDYGINITKDQFPNLTDPARIIKYSVVALNELLTMAGSTFLVFLTIIFMLLELNSVSDKVRAVFKGPAESFDYLSKIINNIRRYLAIKSAFAIATGILIFAALSLIGLDNAILWAVIAALLSFIPNIGSIIAAIPALLFALLQMGLAGAIWTLLSYMIVNNVLGNFLEPRFMGKGLSLSTLVVFLSLIFWRFILGPIGMFLSVPLTMAIKIVLEQSEKTKWLAIILGTHKEAKIHVATRDKEIL